MFKKTIITAAMLICMTQVSFAQLQKNYIIHDVVPTENVTSLEFNPSLEVLENSGGTSVSKMTFKTGFVLNKHLNIGLEVPLARYESADKSKNGLGDVSLALTATQYVYGAWSFGTTFEFVFPTATDDLLGTGKLQFSPSIYAVYMPQSNFFFAAGYKQYWSTIGDGHRADIDKGRFRAIVGYLSDNQWWVMIDPRYTIDYENSARANFTPEVEIGTMINPGASVYLRGGGKVGGNLPASDWTVSIGFKVLHL